MSGGGRPSAHPIARATSNRPFSKRRVWSSLSWFTLRIFTHCTRRWDAVSVTGSSRRWMIPSARNSSSSAVGGASREGSSEISRLVTPRSRSHSKNPNVSARRSSNSRTSSRASHESIARSRKFRFMRSSKIFAFRTARRASPRGAAFSDIDPTFETISSRYSRPRLRSRIGGDAETALVEVHREISGIVLRPSHLHDAEATLGRQVRHEVHPEMDHAVGEELLVVAALKHMSRDDPIRPFCDEEAGDPEVAEPLEQPVDLPSAVFELREDLERFERVDDNQVEPPLVLDRLNALSEALEPVFLLAEEVRGRPGIEDDERSFRDLKVKAEGAHLFEEARAAFLETQVEAMQARARGVLQEDRESERRFHRPRRAFDEDDLAPRDPAFQRLVQTFDEGAHACGPLARSLLGNRRAGSLSRQRCFDGERLLHLVQDVSFPLLFRGGARRPRERMQDFRRWLGCLGGSFGLGDFRFDLLEFLLREAMVVPKLEDLREAATGLREILKGLEDQATLHPGFGVSGMDQGGPIQDGGRRRYVAEHPQNATESQPRLLIFRTQLEGAQIPDSRLVRSSDPQVGSREEDPRPPVFVVAGNRFEERVDRILEPRLTEEADRVLQMVRGLLFRCGGRRFAIAQPPVGLQTMAFSLRLGPDAVHGRCHDVGVILDLWLPRRDRHRA